MGLRVRWLAVERLTQESNHADLCHALRTSRVQLLADAIDAGSAGAATLKLYGGTRPGSGGNVSDQPLLITLPLATPCAQSVTGGVLTLKAIAEAMVSGNGTIT